MMAISKIDIRSIFYKADSNHDSIVDDIEISAFGGTAAEKGILQAGFTEAKLNGYDQDSSTMSIADYLKAMSSLSSQIGITEAFSAEEIQWADRAYVLAQVSTSGWLLSSADPLFMSDREIVFAAVKNTGFMLEFVSPALQADKEIVLAAVTQNGNALQYTSRELQADPEIVLAAVKQNKEALKYAAKIVFDDQFKQQMLIAGSWQFKFTDAQSSKYFLMSNRAQGAVDQLRTMHISKYYRIRNAVEAEQIIAWRAQVKNKTLDSSKRTVLIIFNREDDGRGGYSSSTNDVAKFMDQGYQVLYYEAGTKQEFYAAVREVGQAWPIQLLVIGGHGLQHELTFDATSDLAKVRLDVRDEKELLNLKLASFFSANSKIILDSCLVGAGGACANNLANMLQRVFPQATIYSSLETTMAPSWQFDATGNLINLEKIYGRTTYIPISGELSK